MKTLMQNLFILSLLILLSNSVLVRKTTEEESSGECATIEADWTEVDSIREVKFPYDFTFRCKDSLGNYINKEGLDFQIEILPVSGLKYPTVVLTEKGNGLYLVRFEPKVEDEYIFNINLGDKLLLHAEKQIYNKKRCPPKGDTLGLTFECPNTHKCVRPDEVMKCIPQEEVCPTNSSQFYCNVNGKKTCVNSLSDCDCPEGYAHCTEWYQNQCYPIDRIWECPYLNGAACKKNFRYPITSPDGICRLKPDLKPNKYVCPYGYYQCSDLTCVKSVEECQVYEDCEKNHKVQCDDQTCASSLAECPSRITCDNPNDVVCPDKTCVDNEIKCKPQRCSDPTHVLCPDGYCAKTREGCYKGIACGEPHFLCEDLICRKDCRDK